MSLVKKTLSISLYIQFICLILGSIVYIFQISKNDQILKDILTIENIVQIIEASFYLWFYFYYSKNLDKNDITKYRYFDWLITTPIMLFNTVLYFEYNNINTKKNKNSKNNKNILKIKDFIFDYKNTLIKIFIYNFLMLLFGYLQEINIINLYTSIPFGFLFFALTFYEIYINFVGNNVINITLFFIIFIIWGLYGIASMFDLVLKNSFYNILDLFSKNFYGLYLCFLIFTKKIN